MFFKKESKIKQLIGTQYALELTMSNGEKHEYSLEPTWMVWDSEPEIYNRNPSDVLKYDSILSSTGEYLNPKFITKVKVLNTNSNFVVEVK